MKLILRKTQWHQSYSGRVWFSHNGTLLYGEFSDGKETLSRWSSGHSRIGSVCSSSRILGIDCEGVSDA